jgi:hypothetical protein
MDKSGVVINGLIGPKVIRDFFTSGQFTKKHSIANEFWKKQLQLVGFLGRIDS